MDFLLTGIINAFKLLATFDPETYSAVAASIKVSFYSISTSLIIGIPLGFALGYFGFPGKRHIRAIVDTLLSLPTVFIGLMVYAFKNSKIGRAHV